MKARVIAQSDYVEEFGTGVRGSGADDPETLKLYRQAAALALTERLVVEPEQGEELKALRHSLQGRMRRIAQREKLKGTLRFAVNSKAKHVVIFKLPPAAAPAAPAKHAAVVDSIADAVVGKPKPNGRATREERRSA